MLEELTNGLDILKHPLAIKEENLKITDKNFKVFQNAWLRWKESKEDTQEPKMRWEPESKTSQQELEAGVSSAACDLEQELHLVSWGRGGATALNSKGPLQIPFCLSPSLSLPNIEWLLLDTLLGMKPYAAHPDTHHLTKL